MTGGRRFSLSSPDWGQDHLSLDAIVAYVDDELAAGAHDRAERHLSCCSDCRAEVLAQLQARSVLRRAAGPALPSSLMRSLRSIPVEAELPPPPPGLGITADGQFVLLRDVPRADGHHARAAESTPRRPSRRTTLGAVSGLALGALAVGALAVPGSQDDQGGLPAPSVNVPVQARLTAAPDLPAVDRAASGPVVATPAVAGDPATDRAASLVSTTSPDDDPAVLDAQLRTELDRRPVAFVHHSP
jgi:anti-sigma factor RsiW